MLKKLNLIMNSDNFSSFVDKLQDLTGIEDTIKIKISKDHLLMYSIMGNEGQVSAMKCFLLDTKLYISNFAEEDNYDFVLTSSSKFVKNIKFFDPKKQIKLEISAKPVPDEDNLQQIRTIHLSNGKLKISSIGAELHKIRDLNKKFIDTKLDLKKSKWNFTISVEDFTNIKKLSTINNEDRILNINVLNNKVFFSEVSKWELEVDDVSVSNQHIMFNKKYLSNIDLDKGDIKFHIFENFILIKDDESNLMLSFEQDFSTD